MRLTATFLALVAACAIAAAGGAVRAAEEAKPDTHAPAGEAGHGDAPAGAGEQKDAAFAEKCFVQASAAEAEAGEKPAEAGADDSHAPAADPKATHAIERHAAADEHAAPADQGHADAEAPLADGGPKEPLPGAELLTDAGPDEPYRLVRTLEIVQDQIAVGNRNAHINQRAVISDIEKKIFDAPDAVWKKPSNARAAVIYGLSGGNPKIFDKLLKLGPLPCLSETLLKGLSAYGQGLNQAAKSLLIDIDPLSLGERAGAHLALAEAMLVAGDTPNRAIELLDLVRLLAPGTLLEEAALRRETVIAALIEELPKFEMLSSQYLRRFSKSVYASEFVSRFGVAVSSSRYATSDPDFQRLAAMVDRLDQDARRTLYLALTQAAIVRGQVMLTRSGAGKLTELAGSNPALEVQARLYDGAAMLVTDKYDEATALLRSIDRRTLPERERPLLDAALDLAVRLRLPPQIQGPVTEPPAVSAEQGSERKFDSMDQVIATAKQLLGSADQLLAGEKR
jgi:chemotaxis protein MotC